MSTIFYVDLETTVNGGPEGDSPEAHWKNNKVLLCGWKQPTTGVVVNATVDELCEAIACCIQAGSSPLLIAHNAKFDIKYLMRDRPDVEWHKANVWDTMTWEYRHSGHQEKFMSLEKACKLRGVKFKKSLDLGALLATGVKMEDIPREELKAYLIDDVVALRELWCTQHATTYKCDMDYILPLAEMELNGLTIDKLAAIDLMIGLTKDTEKVAGKVRQYITDHCEWQDGSAIIDEDFTDLLGTKSKYIKAMSARTLSFLLTGSPATLGVTAKWNVRPRTIHSPILLPSTIAAVYGAVNTSAHLGFPMGEQELQKIKKVSTHWMIDATLQYRTDSKLLGTYVAPFVHTSKVQGTIHPKLNTTTTGTGRLSSSGPNGQNIPLPARELVVPSIPGHEIVEIDFKQLELVCVACIANDPQLLTDLRAGVDIHAKTATVVFGAATDENRRTAKAVNFGLLYGGKANGLSKQTGVDKATVQRLIDTFYDRYPRVGEWQKEVFTEVVNNMETHKIQDGEQTYKSMYVDPFSGRNFLFTEVKSPPWLRKRTHRGYSFSPQQTSNYPIQGFAGGDIVMYALTELWRRVRATGSTIKFIMTVHDSIIMEMSTATSKAIGTAMKDACVATQLKFKLPISLGYDIKTGNHWS